MNRLTTFLLLFFVSFVTFAQDNDAIFSSMQATNIDENSATLKWNLDDSVLYYNIEYNVAMSEEVFQLETQEDSINISNLLSATQYVWRIRTISQDFDTSDWSDMKSFYTLGLTTECVDVGHFVLGSLNNNDLLLQWTSDDVATYWEVVCDEIGTNPNNVGARYFTINSEYDFTNLEIGHTYQFAVRSHCSDGYGNWKYLYVKFYPQTNTSSLPLEINFEDSIQNTHINLASSSVNPWIIGSVDDADDQTNGHCLYVSNDNGASATFNNQKSSISYAYVDFFVPQDAVNLSIDFAYKANITSTEAGTKFYLVNSSANLDIDSLPLFTYGIGAELYNNTNGAWENVHTQIANEYQGQNMRLLIVWTNTDSIESNSSVMIDNIYITSYYCPLVDTVIINEITPNSAVISWNVNEGPDTYNIQYRQNGTSTWNTITGAPNNYQLDSLQPNTTYQVRVQADCSSETSLYSDIFTFTTNILVHAIDTSTIICTTEQTTALLTWSYNYATDYFVIRYKQANATIWTEENSYATSFNIDNLTPQTDYLYTICAVSFSGDSSSFTEERNFTTKCEKVAAFPYVNTDTIKYSSISGFDDVPLCYSTLPATLYTPTFNFASIDAAKLSFDVSSSSTTVVYVSDNGGETFTQHMLIPATTNDTTDVFSHQTLLLSDYLSKTNVVVRFAFITIGTDTVNAKLTNLKIEKACSAPTTIYFDSIGYNIVTLSWSNDNMVSSWVVRLFDGGKNYLRQMHVAQNSCTFSQLDSSSTYYVVINSNCDGIESFDSATADFTTQGIIDVVCKSPYDLEVKQANLKGDETILVSWKQPSDANIWEVWYKSVYSFDWQTRIVTITPAMTIRNIDTNDIYEVKVRTICSAVDTSDFTLTDTIVMRSSSLLSAEQNSINISLYPNPTKGILNITAEKGKIDKLFVLDELSKVVFETDKVEEQIDLSNLSSGIYYIIGYIEGKRFSKQIVKQ